MIKTTAKIIFDPTDFTRKHARQSEWKKTAVALFNDDTCDYYAWFILKRYNLKLDLPIRGAHLTIINDKISDSQKYEAAKKKYDKQIIELSFNTDVRSDGEWWWMNAICNDALAIRQEAGLSAKPFWGLHVSIGRASSERRLEHSNYILSLIRKFGNEYAI